MLIVLSRMLGAGHKFGVQGKFKCTKLVTKSFLRQVPFDVKIILIINLYLSLVYTVCMYMICTCRHVM